MVAAIRVVVTRVVVTRVVAIRVADVAALAPAPRLKSTGPLGEAINSQVRVATLANIEILTVH